jgi:hypothetical protein
MKGQYYKTNTTQLLHVAVNIRLGCNRVKETNTVAYMIQYYQHPLKVFLHPKKACTIKL